MQNLRRTPLAHLSRGAGSFAAEGLTAINYQLLALRCGQQPLVGNRLACSAVMVLPELSGRDAATTVSVAASIRHYKNAEGDLFAGGGDGALKGVLKLSLIHI